MFKTYSSSSSLVITSRWFATSHLRAPVSVKLVYYIRLAHWGRDKMSAISQTTFSNAFSWMKMYGFRLRFHLSLFELTIYQNWFRIWLGTDQAISHFLNQWWPRLPTHTSVTRPQWINDMHCLLTQTRYPGFFYMSIRFWVIWSHSYLSSRFWLSLCQVVGYRDKIKISYDV